MATVTSNRTASVREAVAAYVGRQAGAGGCWIFSAAAWVEAWAMLRDLGVEPDYSTADGPRVFAGQTAYVAYSEDEIGRLINQTTAHGIDAVIVRAGL